MELHKRNSAYVRTCEYVNFEFSSFFIIWRIYDDASDEHFLPL